jgi:transcriptional regulator with XRE-family HTH domain
MTIKSLKDPITQRHIYLCTLLRETRINYGYTQAQVAKEVHLSRNSISKIERKGTFRIQHLYLLADFYEIPISQIFMQID